MRKLTADEIASYGLDIPSDIPLRKLSQDEVDALHQQMTHMTSSEGPDYRDVNTVTMSEYAKTLPYIDQAMIAAGRETDKLLAGSKELGYFAQDLFGDPGALKRSIALRNQQEGMDDAYRSFSIGSNPAVRVVGGALPYVVSGSTAGPMSTRLAEAAIDKLVSSPVKAAGTASKNVLTRTIESLASSPNPSAKYVGNRLTDEVLTPMQQWTKAVSNRPSVPNPYTQGFVKDTLGSGLLGGVEGGLHYDNSVPGGALAGTMGAVSGKLLSPALKQSPNYYSDPQKELISWYKQQGAQLLPGMEKGSKRYQNFESQLRKSEAFSDTAGLYDTANQIVNNRIAYKAMGIPEKEIDNLTPEKLSNHIQGLKNQYEDLEKNTVAAIDTNDIVALKNHVKMLGDNPSPDGKKYVKIADAYVNSITSKLEKARNSMGQFAKGYNVYGDNFKQVRSYLKNDIGKAWQKNDMNKVNALQPILDTLDTAVEKGVERGRGSATMQQWKDLNEMYFITNHVLEHGSTPFTDFDANKLLNYAMRQDPKRLQLGSQGRIGDLYKLAQIEYLTKKQDSSLAGLKKSESVLNRGNAGAVEKLLMSPLGGYLPVLPTTALALYRKGIPSSTGLLNMGNNGYLPNLWDKPDLYTRAFAQSSQVHPYFISKGLDMYNSVFGDKNER